MYICTISMQYFIMQKICALMVTIWTRAVCVVLMTSVKVILWGVWMDTAAFKTPLIQVGSVDLRNLFTRLRISTWATFPLSPTPTHDMYF